MIDRRSLLWAGLGGLTFAGSARAADDAFLEAPITLSDRRILVDARLNGKGPFGFVLDSGAVVSGVRKSLAEEVGMRRAGERRLAGRMFPIYLADEMVLGGRLRQENVALFGMENLRLGGEGLLPAGLLTAFDSLVDFERAVWRVYPSGAPDRTGFARLGSTIRAAGSGGSELIYVDVVANGAPLRAVFDTGSPNVLSVTVDIGRRLGLMRDDLPWAPVVQSGILGVESEPSRLVRAESLQIGPYAYERPLVVVRSANAHGESAILGLPVVRTLDFSTDRSAGALWVRRNALAVGRRGYGPSGLWLSEDRGALRVTAVGTGSPAAAAGVQVGDVLAGAKTLSEALPLINGEPGKQVTLNLRRDGRPETATFALAEYL